MGVYRSFRRIKTQILFMSLILLQKQPKPQFVDVSHVYTIHTTVAYTIQIYIGTANKTV